MPTTRRSYRVGEKVQSIIARELLRVADPRFSLVTITSVMMSPDLRNAKVYWVCSGDEERKAEVQEAFEGAVGRFKRTLASELGTRYAPEIRFFYDETLDTVDHIEHLLQSIRGKRRLGK